MEVNWRHDCTAPANYTRKACSRKRGKRVRHVLTRAVSQRVARDTRSSSSLELLAWPKSLELRVIQSRRRYANVERGKIHLAAKPRTKRNTGKLSDTTQVGIQYIGEH